MIECSPRLLFATVLLAGCASASSPLIWNDRERTLAIEGRGVLLTVPDSWTLQKREPKRYDFRLPHGVLSITADLQPANDAQAARAVYELMSETEGLLAARTPPSSFSIGYKELTASYVLPNGKRIVALHRTIACRPLHCHIVSLEESGAAKLSLGLRDEAPKGRHETGSTWARSLDLSLINALLGIGARITETLLRNH